MPTSKLTGVAATATVGHCGPRTIFTGKDRRHAISFTCTREHRVLLADAQARLGLSRADVVGLLVEKYCAGLTRDGFPAPPVRSTLPVFDAFGRRPLRSGDAA